MVITEISMIHHVCIVLVLLWLLNSYNFCHPVVYLISLIYLYQIHERYAMRLRRKLQFDERKAANQRRILTDSETVRWLNHAVEKMWPICLEPIISQRIFLPIIPWFLQKYKPWTVKRAAVQHLYLGRTPPLFTDIRVLCDSTEDDHLVLELGLNFLTGDDMSAILAAKLRKRLGFGIVAKMHLTGLHVEGKVLIGVKFLRSWPFIGRLRVCFAEPPYFQMIVKPLFNHGLDVTELPGIAGWLDNLLAVAFEETLVEPNMLVVDMEKFVSPEPEEWFSVDVKEPLAYANVEVVEAVELKASDLNGFSDPYVKGQLGQYRFRTQVQKKTLTPKWQEEFKVPICSWEGQNVLAMEVLDKDRFSVDDVLGNCSVNINELRDGHRHDMWLPLQNVKIGRLHLAITVVEAIGKGKEQTSGELRSASKKSELLQSEQAEQGPISSANPQPFADTFEPIDIEGQKETGMWVHHPGGEVSQTWEPRKGKSRQGDTEIHSVDSPNSSLLVDSSNSGDESKEDHKTKRGNIIQRGFDKVFNRHHESEEDQMKSSEVADPSLHSNVKAAHIKKVGVNLIVDKDHSGTLSADGKLGGSSNEGSGAENSGKHDVKDRAKKILHSAKNSARHLKQSFSRKGSKKKEHASEQEIPLDSDSQKKEDISKQEIPFDSDSSDEDSLSSSLYDQSLKGIPITSSFISRSGIDDADHLELVDQLENVDHLEHVQTNDPVKPSLDEPVRKSTDSHISGSEGDKVLPAIETKPDLSLAP
ncbi:C2 domain-containing protein At1g53590-like [Chenopodium quinoa]|uniref:C2 domain-containing protein At1g53590-like n=1 Tax=Chenopodium quinoa TaxID=63459 RepID=UPI000B794FAE|nr:C2 domain-containing protein At1g53590-like [Chenopodium quinoa]